MKIRFRGAVFYLALVFTFICFIWLQLPLKTQIITNTSISEGVKTTVAIGESPISVSTNPNTNKIYVSNLMSGTVSVVDGSKNILLSTVTVGSNPQGIDVNSKTNLIYVASQLSNNISVIDGSSDTVIATINVGKKPTGVRVNIKTNKIYVTNQDDNSVSVVDGLTNSFLTMISVGQSPQGIGINSVTNKIYITNYSSDTISIIDGNTNTILTTIQGVSTNPFGVAVDEGRNKIFVATVTSGALLSKGKLYIIDGTNDSIVNNLSIGSNGTDIAFSPVTKKVYITHTFDSTVDVFDSKENNLLYVLNEISDPAGITINTTTNAIYICEHFVNSLAVVEDSNAKIKPSKPTSNSSSSGGIISSELTNSYKEALLSLNDIQSELGQKSKFARPVRAKLDFLIKRFKDAIKSTGEKCNTQIKPLINKLDSTISQLQAKSCNEVKKSRCIPQDVVDDFSTRLETQSELIKSIFDTDDNENMISDLCEGS